MKHTITINGETHDFSETILAHFFADTNSFPDDRMAVIVLCGYLELLTAALIRKHCMNSKRILKDTRSYPWSVLTVILNEKKVISDDQLRMIDWIRGIRNDAAHDAIFEVQEKVIDKYPRSPKPTKENYYEKCLSFLYEWINSDSDLKFFLFTRASESRIRK